MVITIGVERPGESATDGHKLDGVLLLSWLKKSLLPPAGHSETISLYLSARFGFHELDKNLNRFWPEDDRCWLRFRL